MPGISPQFWLVDAGQNWSDVATATGTTKAALAAANGATIKNGTVTPALTAGRVIVLPFEA